MFLSKRLVLVLSQNPQTRKETCGFVEIIKRRGKKWTGCFKIVSSDIHLYLGKRSFLGIDNIFIYKRILYWFANISTDLHL